MTKEERELIVNEIREQMVFIPGLGACSKISFLNNLLTMIQGEKECKDDDDGRHHLYDGPDGFFYAFSRALSILGLSDSQVAQDLDMSAPTIRRWRSWESAPQPKFRKVVYSYLERKVKEELKKLEG